MDDRARVAELLGRTPCGDFEVVVRDRTGDPVVVRNAPFLADGTPMPTRYYLVGTEIVKAVSRIEAAGGVDEVEREIDPAVIAALHRRYAAERDATIGLDHTGPRPSGGVGGTRVGVKCLHAHLANELATGDDAVGRWTLARIPPGTPGVPATSASVGHEPVVDDGVDAPHRHDRNDDHDDGVGARCGHQEHGDDSTGVVCEPAAGRADECGGEADGTG